ncbi:MAG: histidine phosphatase family protein [Planctomycetia bacterium]|nr:MAG: histidine phosphatase family protein [Planctomycetia bacterium]
MIVVLTPCAPSEWRAEGRLLGRVELSISADAPERLDQWAAMLRSLPIARIYHGPDELSTLTARELGKRTRFGVRKLAGLAAVDVGLWAGLSDAELEIRFESTYHELLDAPLNVTPPQGENLGDAAERLAAALQRATRGVRDGEGVAIVLRPLALALLRQRMTGAAEARVWESLGEADEPVIVEIQPAASSRRAKS